MRITEDDAFWPLAADKHTAASGRLLASADIAFLRRYAYAASLLSLEICHRYRRAMRSAHDSFFPFCYGAACNASRAQNTSYWPFLSAVSPTS